MTKLILVSGNVNSSFILNELIYIKNYYDAVCIIDFNGNQSMGSRVQQKYGYQYHNCKINILSINFFKQLWKWFQKKYVREEIKQNVNISIKGLKRLIYILFYGLFCIQGKKIIDDEIESWNGEVDLYAYWLSRPAFLISQYGENRNCKIRNIFSRAHRYDLYAEKNSMKYLPFRKYIDQNLDQIYFISVHGKNYYKEIFKNCAVKSSVKKEISRLGVFKPDYRKTHKNKTEILIVSCSNIIPVKRLDLISDVIAKLQNKNVRWIHFGTGKLKNTIEKQCQKKLSKDRYCIYGNVENEKLFQLYHKLDVDFFINLSDSEGIPVSIMEAMAFGIPVIARNVGGNSEIVNDSNGLLLNDSNANDIAANINNLITKIRLDSSLYESMCDNAYETWNRLYNATDNYKKFYTSVTKMNK